MASSAGCNHSNCQCCRRVGTDIRLALQYTDEKHNIELIQRIISSRTITIQQITKGLLECLCLDDIPPEDVRLTGYTRNDGYYALNIENTQITLEQLDVIDDCILYFEPTPSAPSPKLCQLTIVGPDEVQRVNYQWYRAKTTLGMLLKYIIEKFSLQSVERERIHLLTIIDELDFFSHSNERLSKFHLHSGMVVHVQIIPPLSPPTMKKNKDVQCTSDENQFDFDVPNTETIGKLKTKIEERFGGRQIIDFKVCSETNEEFRSTDSDRTLKSFGVKPGQTVFATFCLITRNAEPPLMNNQSGTSTKSSLSSIAKQKHDKVTVICKFPSRNPESFDIPVTNTINQVISRVESRTTNQHLVISKMSSEKINIDYKNETARCLANLGLKKVDTFTVTLADKSPTQSSIVSRRSASLPQADKLTEARHISKMPIGLINLEGSCYMNSALQCLAHVPQLTDTLLADLHHVRMENGKHIDNDWNPYDQVSDVSGAYTELLWNLFRRNRNDYFYRSFRPVCIKEIILLHAPQFMEWEQQDTKQLIDFVLNTMHKELKEKGQRDTVIEQLFFGEITSTIICTTCNKEESTKHSVSFLSIPFNQQERKWHINFISKDGTNDIFTVVVPINGRVEHVVDEFSRVYGRPTLFYYVLAMIPDGELDFKTSLSKIPTDEFVFMEQEDRLREARPERLKLPQKKSTLVDCLGELFSPEVLEDGWTCTQERCKKNTSATKQLKVCTLPTVLIIQFKRFSHENGLHQKNETFINYPIRELDLSPFLSSSRDEAVYDLIAVSNHMGSIYGGHYTTYALHEIDGNNQWYLFDDSHVSLVSSKTNIISKNAYLLFYIRRNL